MDSDGRIIGVDALIAFPLCPLTTLHAIAYKKTADGGGGVVVVVAVWDSSRRIKVERDLDPDIAGTRNFRIWRFRGVELEPPELELLGILGGDPGAIRTALRKRSEHGGALCG